MPPPRPPEPGLLEGIATARSIHRYLPDPIPDEDLAAILYAATRAPSGSNRQPFRFVVLRDGPRAREAKRLLGDAFRQMWEGKASREGWRQGSGAAPDSRKARSARAMDRFVARFEEIPVVVLACHVREGTAAPRGAGGGKAADDPAEGDVARGGDPAAGAPHPYEGASIYPACQNLLLAARALGYGACFSVWHAPVEAELKELLGIPPETFVAATIPVGRPEGRHGPLRRRPVRELVFDDAWGAGAPWIDDPPDARLSRSRRGTSSGHAAESAGTAGGATGASPTDPPSPRPESPARAERPGNRS